MKDQKIEVPPLPAGLRDVEPEARAYALAAIEADRQRRGEPVLSPKDVEVLLAGMRRFSTQEERNAARKLIAELSAPQPAEPVKCLDPSMSEHACSNRAQCWEPCGELGKSIDHAKVAEPVKSTRPDGGIDADGFFAQLEAEKPAEPVTARVAAATVSRKGYSMGTLLWTDAGRMADLPDGTMLYVGHSDRPLTAQPSIDEDAYVIDQMSKLLAEIAVIVRGPELPRHRHGYADLPERVAALKAASVAAQSDHSEQDLNMVTARPSVPEHLIKTLQGLSDQAYTNYINQMRQHDCLGWEEKVRTGRFTEKNIAAHTKGGELLGRHRAFSEAANMLRGRE